MRKILSMTNQITIFEKDGSRFDEFTDENDIFGYRTFGERLSDLIETYVDESAVFLLDGQWGSGKSVFVRQFSGLLRKRGATVIQIDAFALDYTDDAFVTLSGAIHDAFLAVLEENSESLQRYMSKAKDVAISLVPLGAKIAIRSLSAGILELETIKKSGVEISQAIKLALNESEQAAASSISNRLVGVSSEIAAMNEFRKTLGDLTADLSKNTQEGEDQFPLIFIIDELDRCKPSFALDLIEKVKHFFDVENLFFLLVANMPQLEASISGLYGADFDAKTYLEKFYHHRILLPVDRDNFGKRTATYINYLFKKQNISFATPNIAWDILQFINLLVILYDLELRQIERIVTNIALVQRATGERYHIVNPIVAGLCVMRIVNPFLYEKVRKGKIEWEEIRQFLTRSKSEDPTFDIEKVMKGRDFERWKIAAGGAVPDALMNSTAFEYGRFDPENPNAIILDMCKFIDEFAPH